MVDVLETDALFATVTGKRFLDPAVDVGIEDADGRVLASAYDRAGAGRLFVRAFLRGRSAGVAWDLVDADGNRVLEIAKPSESLRGPSPEVSLADGTLLGRAVPAKRLNPKARGPSRVPGVPRSASWCRPSGSGGRSRS